MVVPMTTQDRSSLFRGPNGLPTSEAEEAKEVNVAAKSVETISSTLGLSDHLIMQRPPRLSLPSSSSLVAVLLVSRCRPPLFRDQRKGLAR